MEIKIPLLLVCAVLFCGNVFSQTESKDSIYSGRVCFIILYNGFESDGIITKVHPDTIYFINEYTEYKIAVKDIKYIRSTSEVYEEEEDEQVHEIPADTSMECSIYMESGTLLTDVRIIDCSDSSVSIVKERRRREIPIINMRKIVFTGSGFTKGFVIGAGVGFASGLLLGLTWPDGSHWEINFGQSFLLGLMFSVPSGVIGGLIGVITKTDKDYMLPPGYSKSKAKRIKYIFEENKE